MVFVRVRFPPFLHVIGAARRPTVSFGARVLVATGPSLFSRSASSRIRGEADDEARRVLESDAQARVGSRWSLSDHPQSLIDVHTSDLDLSIISCAALDR